ncbi:MAG: AraC family transcriptional regulator [Hespellia sp.]|nr:AraC family transcriptional regulator [Hespellia sp.]
MERKMFVSREDFSRAFNMSLHEANKEGRTHSRYKKEKQFNGMIKNGEVEKLESILDDVTNGNIGRMSKNPLRQQMYEFVVGVSVATRYAMDGGLAEDMAYTLSDLYIQQADVCISTEEIWKLYRLMVLDFAKLVAEARNTIEKRYSPEVDRAMDYILMNLHGEIGLEDVADKVGLSKSYFSTKFKQEVGESVTEFTLRSRVKEAERLLQYSDFSLADIGQYVGFSSQSHFANVFQKYTGTSPGKFRKTYFKSSW